MKKKLNLLYQTLALDVKPYQEFYWDPSNYYIVFLKAALAKSIEFNSLVNSLEDEETSMLLAPSLRGITEDIIVLSFINTFITQEKNELLFHLTMTQKMKILKEQRVFFDEYKPEQMVYDVDDQEQNKKFHDSEIKNIMKLNGYNNMSTLPNTREMAQKVGVVKLYDFIFRATSEFVHFSPHILLRMGWIIDATSKKYLCSTKNFSKYYSFFNSFYGSFLFVKFAQIFDKELRFSNPIKKTIEDIETLIMAEFEFPELITLEEMNVENVEGIRTINRIRAIKRNIKLREDNK